MEGKRVLEIVLREMTAIGLGWRLDWSGFDGRILRDQLDSLAYWAHEALASEDDDMDYTEGTEFCKSHNY